MKATNLSRIKQIDTNNLYTKEIFNKTHSITILKLFVNQIKQKQNHLPKLQTTKTQYLDFETGSIHINFKIREECDALLFRPPLFIQEKLAGDR
jgi:hypothetical protein